MGLLHVRAIPLLAVALVAACGPRASSEFSGPHELYRALMDGGKVVLVAEPGALGDAAERAALRLSSLGLDVVVRAPGATVDGDAARILALEVGDPDAAEWLDLLGVERRADGALGFRFLDRDYGRPEDWLRFVLPDPTRPALPLVLSLGNDARRMARDSTVFDLGWRPSFACYRAGELEREGRLVPRGKNSATDGGGNGPRAEVERDLFEAWAQEAAGRTVFVRRGIAFSAPARFSVELAEGYVNRAAVALGRGRALGGEATAPLPTGEPRTSLVAYLHTSAGRMFALTGRAELAFPNSQGTFVHVLVDPALPDDGGAALVTAELEHLLGPAAEPWFARAVGHLCAGTFWGKPLDVWCAWLHRGGLSSTAHELSGGAADPLESPLRVHPLQARLVGLLLERGGTDRFLDLWNGTAKIEVDEELELAWAETLNRLVADHGDDFDEVRARRRASSEARAHLSGARCDVADDARWFDPVAEEGLEDLAREGAQLALFSFACWAPWEAEVPPGAAVGPTALRGDLELFAAVGAARRAGLAAALAPEVLSSEHGHLIADTIQTTLPGWEAVFARLGRATLHYALLGELAGAEHFVLGMELPKATRNAADERLAPELADFRRSAWRERIARTRGATAASLTYGASSGDEPDWVEFWDELDYVGLMAFSPLVPEFARGRAPTHGELYGALMAQFAHLGELSDRVGKPALVLGIGFPATAGSWATPWMRSGPTDALAQEQFYRAFSQSWREARGLWPGLAGAVAWTWRADRRATSARDFAVDGRPAQRHLPELFERP
ncbi:MAG: hypothetical protein GC161_12635 [Planctomycetaceae bacterium]|nr:hypothetical protein [Planctomycetaceae bacterium]